jgi:sugar/nucleoside kinase (ribokinase family)
VEQPFDIAFLGHYTQDTIISSSGTRLVHGGAFNYGAHVAARMGLRVAAITRLAEADRHVLEALEALGVALFVQFTDHSTCLRLEYPSSNVDERIITVTSSAGPFTPQEVAGILSRAFVIGASLRGEVSLPVMEALADKEALIAADVQGFVRVCRDGILVNEPWEKMEALLARVHVLKTDAVEAEFLTGEKDLQRAARALAALGPSEVVLTHADGLLVHADGAFYQAGFYPRELVGRSGRGDTTLAAYVSRRLDASPSEATIWAAAVASLKMEAEGPFGRDLEEVERLVQEKYGSPSRPPQSADSDS